MANKNNFLRSGFEIENSGLCLKIRSTAISIVSFSGILVKRLSTSKEMRNLSLKSKLLSSSTKEKESLTEYLLYPIKAEQGENLSTSLNYI